MVHENQFDAPAILALMIVDILKNAANTSMEDITCCITTVGPGSFTGIRTGISTAHGIAAANLGIKLIGVTTFDAMRASCDPFSSLEKAIFAVDTKRGDYYFQGFNKGLSDIPKTGNVAQIILFARNQGYKTIITNSPENFLSCCVPTGINIVNQKIKTESLFKFAENFYSPNKLLSPVYVRDAAVTVKK